MELYDIPGFEGHYKITKDQRVYGVRQNCWLTPMISRGGYLRMRLYSIELGRNVNIGLHKLMALTFIPNPNGYTQINHKDENKQNNAIENLEWCDAKYNSNYGNRNKKIGKALSKQIKQFTKDNALVAIYPSLTEASKQTGISKGNISNCANGRRNQAGGYVWQYDFQEDLLL